MEDLTDSTTRGGFLREATVEADLRQFTEKNSVFVAPPYTKSGTGIWRDPRVNQGKDYLEPIQNVTFLERTIDSTGALANSQSPPSASKWHVYSPPWMWRTALQHLRLKFVSVEQLHLVGNATEGDVHGLTELSYQEFLAKQKEAVLIERRELERQVESLSSETESEG